MNLLKPAFAVLRSSVWQTCKPSNCTVQQLRRLKSTSFHKLHEFFDNEDNLHLSNIYVVRRAFARNAEVPRLCLGLAAYISHCGRPWRKEELRLKSNEDLHKLWYVFLKERNMLMTMEQVAFDQEVEFASPDRVFKVEESMENLMEVVKERDVAYNVLNFNKVGQPRKRVTRNFAGVPFLKTETESVKPREHNRLNKVLFPDLQPWMVKYVSYYEQKLRKKYRYDLARCKQKQQKLMEKFPHLKPEDVKHIQPNDRKLRQFLKYSAELNDHDFKQRPIYNKSW